ncbi:hypothetical protein ACFQY0_02585 [Haloferula chungangensis]|uniref:HEAT repeat domain-containing protein n=1 Tax=Haloferula chungangensis TaxID=1048331 RepID=A0ABW2L4K1_9BACT
MKKPLPTITVACVLCLVGLGLVLAIKITGSKDTRSGETHDPFNNPNATDRSGGSSLTSPKPPQSLEERRASLTRKLEEVFGHEDFREHPAMLHDLLLDASVADLQLALEISRGHPQFTPGFIDSFSAAVYERWFGIDPVTAISEVAQSDLTENRKRTLIENLLEDWANRSPKEALSFFLKEGSLGVESDHLYGAIARGSSSKGDLNVLEQILDHIADPKLRSFAVRQAARNLQQHHTAKFEEWVGTLSPADQPLAIGESAWLLAAGQDIDQALHQLTRLEDMSADNHALVRRRVLAEWAEHQPIAAEWLLHQRVQGEEREVLFANLLSHWLSQDRGLASRWLEDQVAAGALDHDFVNRVAERL